MKYLNLLLCSAATIAATPLPQQNDEAGIANTRFPAPFLVPLGAGSDRVAYDPEAVQGLSYNDAYNRQRTSKKWLFARTDTPCSAQPLGQGPTPNPDDAATFSAYQPFADAANNAQTPTGFLQAFKNLNGSTSLPMGYLGYDSISSYDPSVCASKCGGISGCSAFNLFFERDPTQNPADSCPNPTSTTTIKCSYWGAPVGPESATNYGQTRNSFQSVNAGSNGYNIIGANSVQGYTGTPLGNAAINAPTSCNTYITYKLYNDGMPYDPNRCAAACKAETDFNRDHLNSRAVCRFFDSYILSKNGVPQGQVCSLYTASWDSSYATNTGYSSDGDTYTISYSFSYSNTTDPHLNDCSCSIGSTCNTGVTTTSSISQNISTSIVSSATGVTTASSSVAHTTSTSVISSATSISSAGPTTRATTSAVQSTTSAAGQATSKAVTTTKPTSTTLSAVTTKSSPTTSPTSKPQCFKVKVIGQSYCNNKYVGLDSQGQFTYGSSPTTFYLDKYSLIRTSDNKYGKCSSSGSILFGTAQDRNSVSCTVRSGYGSSYGSSYGSYNVVCSTDGGNTYKDIYASKSSAAQGILTLGSVSGGDKVTIQLEFCGC